MNEQPQNLPLIDGQEIVNPEAVPVAAGVTEVHPIAKNQAALQAGTSEPERRFMVTADGRVRYLDSQGGVLVWVYPQTGEIEPIPFPKKRGRIKRVFMAFGSAIVLYVLAAIFLLYIGDGGVQTLNQTISDMWMFATYFRVALYAVVSWLFLPVIVRTIRARAQNRMYARRYVAFAEDPNGIAYSHAIQQIEAQEAKIARFRIPGWACFVGLLVFDALVVQLPFLIK